MSSTSTGAMVYVFGEVTKGAISPNTRQGQIVFGISHLKNHQIKMVEEYWDIVQVRWLMGHFLSRAGGFLCKIYTCVAMETEHVLKYLIQRSLPVIKE